MRSTKAIVAIVDDEGRVLKSLGNLLSSAGYDVRLFSSAENFLASPDIEISGCFISDIRLPGMSGIELLRRVNAMETKLPGILLTDRFTADAVLYCRTEGARFIFQKPPEGPELLAAVALLTSSLEHRLEPAVASRSPIAVNWRDLWGRFPGNAVSHFLHKAFLH